MRIKLILSTMIISVIAILAGCGNEIQDDLISYVNDDIKPLAKDETEVMNEYESITGANYTDDETTYNTLKDSTLPKYLAYIDKIEAIQPDTKEVKELHEKYIEASNLQYNAMLKILSALESQDYNEISEANQMLSDGRAKMRDYINEVGVLAKENNVKLNQ